MSAIDHASFTEAQRSASDPVRIAMIEDELVIGYPAMDDIINDLSSFVENPAKKPSYRAIFARSGNGKTTTAMEFVKKYPVDINPLGDSAYAPVVRISMPPVSSVREFALRILIALNELRNDRASGTLLLSSAQACLKTLGTRVLVLDEFQHLNTGSAREIAGTLNTIKELGEYCNLTVAAFGMPEAVGIIEQDYQFSRRFKHLVLQDWEYDLKTCQFIHKLEINFPLRKPPCVAQNAALVIQILEKADYTISGIVEIMTLAAIKAIETGKEQIDMKIIDAINWVKPSDRHSKTLTDLNLCAGDLQTA